MPNIWIEQNNGKRGQGEKPDANVCCDPDDKGADKDQVNQSEARKPKVQLGRL